MAKELRIARRRIGSSPRCVHLAGNGYVGRYAAPGESRATRRMPGHRSRWTSLRIADDRLGRARSLEMMLNSRRDSDDAGVSEGHRFAVD